MDQFKQISAFVDVASRGSLSAAARIEGVTPAIIGRRLDALEERLGAKLLLRTTRRISLTFEGCGLPRGVPAHPARTGRCRGRGEPGRHPSRRASEGFCTGRIRAATRGAPADGIHDGEPGSHGRLELSDRLVDLVEENVDCAIRIGDLADSSLISIRLGEMRRVVVASPDYIARFGVPPAPTFLAEHNCLSLRQQRGWTLRVDGEVRVVKVSGGFECNDGAVLHDWALAGKGLAWRSLWEVGADIKAGRLLTVLDELPRRRSASTPWCRNAATCRCGYARSSTC
jgi:DNA-binding transcriptional LysR family regulator